MIDHDRIRIIVERDFFRRMNQLGGTLYMYSIQGTQPYEDLVIEVHNELTDQQIDDGAEIMQWWLVSDAIGERMKDTGFLVMETVDGWFYGRTTAGTGLEDDVQRLLLKEASMAASKARWGLQKKGQEAQSESAYPDRYPDGGSHEDPLHDETMGGSEC